MNKYSNIELYLIVRQKLIGTYSTTVAPHFINYKIYRKIKFDYKN